MLVHLRCGINGWSQDDMSRTEELTTKLRTLSYDHERLTSMYKTQTEKAANAKVLSFSVDCINARRLQGKWSSTSTASTTGAP